ncbi:MAG: cold shock and DUF1294 domain-containing protein [Sedimenticola sp.]
MHWSAKAAFVFYAFRGRSINIKYNYASLLSNQGVSHKKANMRTKGKISSWNDEKGYGFIDPIGGGKRVFVHIKAFGNRSRRPELGQVITYAVSTDRQGRPCAVNATLAGDRLSQKTKKPEGVLSITGAAIFLVIVGIAVITSKVPPVIFSIYLVSSLITFVVYAMDKSAARKGGWRTQESTLHILSLIGGWPGALVAQQKLRHKSKKRSFRAVFWVTVIANCGAFVWALTPSGAITLRSMLTGVV